ncbi:hypothetical protein Hanom_Chr10g00935641 [Helianthus anomalus]
MRLNFHDLRSSDMAEGIQCVNRISRVAFFAILVRNTTICSYSRSNFRNSSVQLSTIAAKLFKFLTGFLLKART